MEINFKQLEEEVLEQWESDCIDYTYWDSRGDSGRMEPMVYGWADEILSDPLLMVQELGFSRISDYMAYQNGWVSEETK